MFMGEIIIMTAIVAFIPITLWGLIDCATNEPEPKERTNWILIIVFTNIFGAILYLIFRRPLRKKKYGK